MNFDAVIDIPECKICDNKVKWNKNKKQFRLYCSRTCASTDLARDAKQKRKQTNLLKYGVENPFQSQEVQQKIKETNLLKYGVENPLQNKEIHKKQKQTNLERYGVENIFSSTIVKEKTKQTNLEKYGVEHPLQNTSVKEKTKQTNLERYGVDYPSKLDRIKEKTKQTNLEKYGVINSTQRHYSEYVISKLNSFEYLYNEYVNKNKTSKQIAEELNVDPNTICDYLRIHNIPIFQIKSFSKLAIQWLESIMEKEFIYIQHAGNIGEYNIPNTRLLVDGYCSSNNTVYEFYGDCFHGNLEVYKEEDYCHPFNPSITTIELYKKTMEREERIRELGYKVETIWENEYEAKRTISRKIDEYISI